MSSPGGPLVHLAAPTREDDLIVHEWMEADHVRCYWGDPHKNFQQYSQSDDGAQRRIINTGNRKVGLILWQHPTRRELDEAGLADIPESVVDIDVMIGEPDMVGRGIGSEAIRMVAEQSLLDAAVPFVIAATRTDNVASRRAFEKAGFRTDREFDDPGYGRCVLMIRHRTIRPRIEVPEQM
jgi:RimJ/RimL family protein N-acetyltransferase